MPAGPRRGRWLPDHRDVRRRWVVAQAADAARARSVGADRRAHAQIGGRPPAADHCGRARPDPDRVRAAGGVGAAQIGGAAGRPRGAGRNHHHRTRGDARPYREDAHPFRRGGTRRAGRAGRPPHHAARSAGAGAGADRRSRRPVFGGLSADRGADHAGLGGDPRRRHDESAAHWAPHHARRDGRVDRIFGRDATRAARRSPTFWCAPRRCAASRFRPRVRRR